MIAKLITYGKTRQQAITKMQQALDELIIDGINTNQSLHQKIIKDQAWQTEAQNIHFLENWLQKHDT